MQRSAGKPLDSDIHADATSHKPSAVHAPAAPAHPEDMRPLANNGGCHPTTTVQELPGAQDIELLVLTWPGNSPDPNPVAGLAYPVCTSRHNSVIRGFICPKQCSKISSEVLR